MGNEGKTISPPGDEKDFGAHNNRPSLTAPFQPSRWQHFLETPSPRLSPPPLASFFGRRASIRPQSCFVWLNVESPKSLE
jgi:hypothetical protein